MDERVSFIVESLRGELTMSALCEKYVVSRKTGYKWLTRFREEGKQALRDRSRACLHHPNATSEELAVLLIDARKSHPTWGARKLVAWLEMKYPRVHLPSPSTVGEILKRYGLTRRRRKRHKAPPYAAPFRGCDEPNAVWCADFKGSFALGNGRRCNPLTISDGYSRLLLRCEGLTWTDAAHVQPIFESAFYEFGRPWAIRTDNGPPFATIAAGGLSRLAIWLIKLEIRPERIAPGKPQQNGRHERMHRTLKAETTKPPARTMSAQQLAFDRFRRIYNNERPHEALGQKPPWTAYEKSERPYPVRLREPEYPSAFAVRTVRHDGTVRWKNERIYLAETLASERVGIEEVDDDRWGVYFADVALGTLTGSCFTRATSTSTALGQPAQPEG